MILGIQTMTSPLIDPLWKTYRDKILTDYPQAVPKGESYVKEYLANWAQYLITQHGIATGTAYIQKINNLLHSQPDGTATHQTVSNFDNQNTSQFQGLLDSRDAQYGAGMVQRTFTVAKDRIVIALDVKDYAELVELRDKQDSRRRQEREAKATIRNERLQQLAQDRGESFTPSVIKPYKTAITWDRLV